MLKVFEAFSGYGSQSLALERLGIPHQVVAISEIDKYAIQGYYSLHDTSIPNLGDISKIKVEDIPDHDLFTYSFPCQDISVAGRTRGIVAGETRSGLLYECEKIIEGKKPKYLLMENVKNLVGKKFKADFDKWLDYLEGLGYTNYWKVLNAKHYGVPQNRERVFVVSILGEHDPYVFPSPIPLETRVKDLLEDEVASKYYLSEKVQERFRQQYADDGTRNIIGTTAPEFRTIGQRDIVYGHNAETMGSLVATDYKQPKQIAEPQLEMVGMLDIKGNDCIRRVYSQEGLCPSLTTMQGGNRQPEVVCEQRCDEGLRFFKDEVCGTIRTINSGGDKRVIEFPCIGASRGRNPENPSSRVAGEYTEQRIEVNSGGTSNTLSTVQKDNYVLESAFKIRKLTPRECFRLMGLNDTDIDKIQAYGISDTQQYKMAGNSIVVDVLMAIFKNLF